jgi:hypothetical protein
MKTSKKIVLPAIAATIALVFAIATPFVMAESGYGMHSYQDGAKSHMSHWAIVVNGFEGSIPITEDSDRTTLKEQAIPLSEAAADYPDVKKAKLGKAINENGDKFLVWKLVDYIKDSESETAIMTIYIVDAGDAENTAVITKEFDKTSHHDKWTHYKGMKGQFADMTPEEREAKFAQFKEMKEAFASLSEDDQTALKSHFKGMKGQYADLTVEEKEAKHTEHKQQMEAFMGLSLDEKINYLKQIAMSFRNQA